MTNYDTSRHRLVFHCTPELPYSPTNLVKYIAARGNMSPGAINHVSVRHDGWRGMPCPNCGVRLR
jgi:hypothetical protein